MSVEASRPKSSCFLFHICQKILTEKLVLPFKNMNIFLKNNSHLPNNDNLIFVICYASLKFGIGS